MKNLPEALNLPEEVLPEAKEKLENLLREYGDVFSASDKDLGRTQVCEHHIETEVTRPIRQPLRRQPLSYRTAIDATKIDDMLTADVIKPTVS